MAGCLLSIKGELVADEVVHSLLMMVKFLHVLPLLNHESLVLSPIVAHLDGNLFDLRV